MKIRQIYTEPSPWKRNCQQHLGKKIRKNSQVQKNYPTATENQDFPKKFIVILQDEYVESLREKSGISINYFLPLFQL